MEESPERAKELFGEWAAGNREALDSLMPYVYKQLHGLAHRHLRRERPNHTLQTTALVNEIYILLAGQRRLDWKDKGHFFSVCAHLLRRILVDYARHKNRAKRGGGLPPIDLESAPIMSAERSAQVVLLDEALNRLEHIDQRKHKIIELRYFGGLTTDQIADLMGISPRTVMRDWQLAKAWLRREMSTS